MIVVVTGASGPAGRAACGVLRRRGHVVVAVGTDAGRLGAVDADDRRVADLSDADAARTLASDVASAHDRVDAVLHLVGGWRGGSSAEADAWLRPRLVDSLANVIESFGPQLAASGGRLAIVSSSAVKPSATPGATSSYARAKVEAERLVGALAERLVPEGGAATVFVIGSLGEGGTPAAALAERLASWLTEPADRVNGSRRVVPR